MLEVLVESAAKRRGSARPGLAALTVHGAVVVVMILGPRPGAAPSPRTLPGTIDIYVPPATEQAGEPMVEEVLATIEEAPGIPTVTVEAPPAFDAPPSEPGPTVQRPSARELAGRELGREAPGSRPIERGRADGGIRLAGEVDEAAAVLVPKEPVYPIMMAASGIAGRVVVEFVVDTLGRAEAGSIRIIRSSHRAFESAALEAVLGTTFRPARSRGRLVRQLVRQGVVFGID